MFDYWLDSEWAELTFNYLIFKSLITRRGNTSKVGSNLLYVLHQDALSLRDTQVSYIGYKNI